MKFKKLVFIMVLILCIGSVSNIYATTVVLVFIIVLGVLPVYANNVNIKKLTLESKEKITMRELQNELHNYQGKIKIIKNAKIFAFYGIFC